MSGERKKANRITDVNKMRLWEWLRNNKDGIEGVTGDGTRWTLTRITKGAEAALEMVLTRDNVRSACKLHGIRWARDPRGPVRPKVSDQLKARIKELEEKVEAIQRGPTGLVDVYGQLHKLHVAQGQQKADLHTAQQAVVSHHNMINKHADALTDAWKRDQGQWHRIEILENMVRQLCDELGVKTEATKDEPATKQHENGQFHTTRIVR